MNLSFEKINDQKGMSLVELLAVLLLMSLIIGVLWTTIMYSIKYSTIETRKIKLQQEANFIITEIQSVHRKCDSYILKITTNDILIKDCSDDSDRIISNNFNFNESYIVNENTVMKNVDAKKKDASYKLYLYIEDLESKGLKVKITTQISRYKSD